LGEADLLLGSVLAELEELQNAGEVIVGGGRNSADCMIFNFNGAGFLG